MKYYKWHDRKWQKTKEAIEHQYKAIKLILIVLSALLYLFAIGLYHTMKYSVEDHRRKKRKQ